MHRNLSTAMRRWGSQNHGPEAEHLCTSCQGIAITQALIKNIPVSRLPNGRLALDLVQRFINLPMSKKDDSPLFTQLSITAAAGCEFCTVLFDAIMKERTAFSGYWAKKIGDAEVVIKFRYCCGPELGLGSFEPGQWPTTLLALEAVIYRKDRQKDPEPIIIVFKVSSDPDSVVGDYLRIRRRPVDSITLSSDNLRMVKDWIQDCRNNHFACSPLANTSMPMRPTRLVYVGDPRRGHLPRLTMGQYLPADVRYAALSYCWGSPSSMRLITTSETLHSRLGGIPWNQIPKTFHDAFLAARRLGLEYIWIDALCIIQNDDRDWQIEATMMGDIYRGAQITFVAAASRSTNEGFLERSAKHRHPTTRFYFRLPVYEHVGGHYYLTYSSSGYKEQFGKDVEESVWNGRGWTFQERQLARRVLFFGKECLYFECRMHRRMEGYTGVLNRSLALYKHMQNTDDWDVLHLSWRKVIEEFSSRKFTFYKDRLPALSGLAREMILKWTEGTGEKAQYLAGLWRQSLEIDLTWKPATADDGTSVHQQDASMDRPFQSPTWSWAMFPGRVVWSALESGGILESLCKVRRASTRLKASDQLGEVDAGFIDVVGSLAEVRIPSHLVWSPEYSWTSAGVETIPRITFHNFDSSNLGQVPSWWTTGIYLYIEVIFDFRSYAEESVWLALTSAESNTEENFRFGLILEPVDMSIQETPAAPPASATQTEYIRQPYKRIGIFRVPKRNTHINCDTTTYSFPYNQSIEAARGFRHCHYRVL